MRHRAAARSEQVGADVCGLDNALRLNAGKSFFDAES
jgi:hypothetical protein